MNSKISKQLLRLANKRATANPEKYKDSIWRGELHQKYATGSRKGMAEADFLEKRVEEHFFLKLVNKVKKKINLSRRASHVKFFPVDNSEDGIKLQRGGIRKAYKEIKQEYKNANYAERKVMLKCLY